MNRHTIAARMLRERHSSLPQPTLIDFAIMALAVAFIGFLLATGGKF
jgi:hypothetical protein